MYAYTYNVTYDRSEHRNNRKLYGSKWNRVEIECKNHTRQY